MVYYTILFEKKIYKIIEDNYTGEFLDDEIDVFTDKGVIITRYNLLQKN